MCIFDFNEKNNTCHDKGGRIGSYEHKEPSTAVIQVVWRAEALDSGG